MADLAMIRLHDGAELWTAVSGTGPPVVCLHGGRGLWDYLAPLAALLDDMPVTMLLRRPCAVDRTAR
jgi:proline iminopeptidase